MKPTIVTYNASNIKKTIDDFLGLCREYHIEITHDKTAVLYRSKGFYHQITDSNTLLKQDDPWILEKMYVREMAYGKFLYDHNHFKEGFKKIERALFKVLSRKNYCSDNDITETMLEEGF